MSTTVRITPNALRGAVTPPPSKSQAHRAILCAALAGGESVLSNVADSQDIQATLGCITALGASWKRLEGNGIRITGLGERRYSGPLPRLDCGESGSTLRFLIPIALAVAGGGIFTGRGRLMERPQQPYFDLFEEKGIFYEQKDGVLTVRGRLEPGEYRLPGNVSSQFFTGLLLALPLLPGESYIRTTTQLLESYSYIAMTMDTQFAFGTTTSPRLSPRQHLGEPEDDFHIFGPEPYHPCDLTIEADWSQAAFWYAANFLGSRVEIQGLNPASAQGDRIVSSYYWKLAKPGDVDLDVSQCPDLVPPLAAMAAVRKGTTRIVNAARLRMKESDRLATVAATLNALGARVEELPDSLIIQGLDGLTGGVSIDCCNDHRIAMMAAVAATQCAAPVTLLGAQCVNKSYPNFWEHYRMLGGELDVLISG